MGRMRLVNKAKIHTYVESHLDEFQSGKFSDIIATIHTGCGIRIAAPMAKTIRDFVAELRVKMEESRPIETEDMPAPEQQLAETPSPYENEQIEPCETNSLDLAAYLMMHGYNYNEVKPIREAQGRPGYILYNFTYYMPRSVFQKLMVQMRKGIIGKFLTTRKYLKDAVHAQSAIRGTNATGW